QKIEEAGDPFVTADNTVNMPAQAPPGEYKVQMSLRDKVGGGTTTFNSTFHVEGDAAAGETPAAGETSSAGETPSSGGGGALQLAEVRFAEAQEGPDRENSTFAGDEDVWVLFSLTGFEQKEDGGVWIQEDLQVLDPDGTPILDEKNLLDFQEPVDPGLDAIPAHNQITLPEGAAAGDYTVHMVVRDQLAGTSVEQKKTFKVQ
ncbi:MAG: hypothetical protein HY319_11175, partial [Armatimonadetes bacterium]|nr:hypothetical protein [Armatimonadota bacterium]